MEYAKGLKNIPVPAQLQVNEAASIYEVWQKDNALYSRESLPCVVVENGGDERLTWLDS